MATTQPFLNDQQVAKIVKALEAQGAVLERNSVGQYGIDYDGGHATLSLRSPDKAQVFGCRRKVKQLGLWWPLDEQVVQKRDDAPVEEEALEPLAPPPGYRADGTRIEEDRPVTVNTNTHKGAIPVSQALENITPEVAELFLSTMEHNRKLSSQRVSYLAKQMKDGLWVFDGSPIKFNVDGELVDGQHRLWAVIESQKTFKFLVVRGVPREAMATMDTGKTRSFSDILVLEDASLMNVPSVASAINIIYRWEIGMRGSAMRTGHATNVVPNGILLDYFRDNKERLIEVARDGSTLSKKLRGITSSATSLCLWVLEAIDEGDSQYFFLRLADGIGLPEGSPILALRNYIQRVIASSPGNRQSIPVDLAVALVFKAWNAYREGNELQVMSFRRGGANPEQFPVPQ